MKQFRVPSKRFSSALLLVAIAGGGFSPSASAQNVVGEIFGKLIGPAVQPVLERAAGELVLEGLRRGADGKLIPRPRPRPMPSPQPVPRPYPQPYPQPTPQPQPYPQPTPQPYPQPIQVQPSPSQPIYLPQPGNTYSQPVYSQPVYSSEVIRTPPSVSSSKPRSVPSAPAVAAPANKIVTRLIAPTNASPLDIALRNVIGSGPKNTAGVIRNESAQIAQVVDGAMINYMRSQPGLQPLLQDYQAVATTPDGGSRLDTLTTHASAIAENAAATGIQASIQIAEISRSLSRMPDSTSHQEQMAAIEAMRNQLALLNGQIIDSSQLAVLAQRAKNLRNMAVTTEVARVLGVQRRSDLFEQVEQASQKSQAPRIASEAILGLPLGDIRNGVADMELPPGNPKVVLYNPIDSTGDITFVCDGKLTISLGPGELVPIDQSFVLSFENGAGITKRYTLKKGLFRWTVGPDGWDVREKKKIRFTIDASASPVPFRYLFNGEPQELAAGAMVEHLSPVPPRLDYDAGKGDSKKGKRETKTTLITPGDYIVGVDPERGAWDIFEKETEIESDGTSVAVAREHWRQSVLATTRASADPVQSQVDSLLNSIE